MNDTLSNARERSHNAVRTLVVHCGSVQERLYLSYVELLGIESNKLGDNPMRYQLEGIMKDCIEGKRAANQADDAKAVIYSISDVKAAEIAERILKLFLDIDRELLIQNIPRI